MHTLLKSPKPMSNEIPYFSSIETTYSHKFPFSSNVVIPNHTSFAGTPHISKHA